MYTEMKHGPRIFSLMTPSLWNLGEDGAHLGF
jgi:hypothetical protein